MSPLLILDVIHMLLVAENREPGNKIISAALVKRGQSLI